MGESDSGFLLRDEGLYEQIHTTLFSHVQCCPFPHVVVNAWGGWQFLIQLGGYTLSTLYAEHVYLHDSNNFPVHVPTCGGKKLVFSQSVGRTHPDTAHAGIHLEQLSKEGES